MADYNRFGLIACVNQGELASLRAMLITDGFRLFQLNGSNVHDRSTFLEEASRALPHEPGVEVVSKWDALVDSLWGGLAIEETSNVTFLWTDAQRMLEHGLPDLLTAVSCLEHLARQVATPSAGFPRAVRLITFLLGEGDNFPRRSL